VGQDCVLTIPPYPYYIGEADKFNLQDDMDQAWHGRLQLLFSCTLCPTGERDLPDGGPSAFKVDLAFFSTFEPLPSPPAGVTQDYGCQILYEPKGKPCLYVNYLSAVLCRTSLTPCFLDGNSRNTIPYSRRGQNRPAMGIKADTAADKGDGSLLFETNRWMWSFGRAMPRTMTVRGAVAARAANASASRHRGVATRKRRREERAAAASRNSMD
jgi:hypothetical protein